MLEILIDKTNHKFVKEIFLRRRLFSRNNNSNTSDGAGRAETI